MLAIGDIVKATVTDVRVFGVFCSSGEDELLVLIPETSWIASFNSCEQFAAVGDVLTVKIKNVDAASGKIAGTIKELNLNPWESDSLEMGKEHIARVIRCVPKADRCQNQPAYLVELVPGAFAMLCANDKQLGVGDEVPITIEQSDSSKLAVKIALRQTGS